MRSALGLVVSLALFGCTEEMREPDAIELTEVAEIDAFCTFRGCLDGVRIDLTGPAASESFTGAIDFGDSERVEIACPGTPARGFDYACDGASVMVFMPSSVLAARLSIATDRGAMQDDIKLTFEPVYPNGPECGAACEQARATVHLE